MERDRPPAILPTPPKKARMNITIPKELLTQPVAVREGVVAQLRQMIGLPAEISVTTKGGSEHNMWSRNTEPLLADVEDDFYDALVEPAMERMAEVFAALGLSLDGVDMSKAFTDEFAHYEGELLVKASGGKRKSKKEQFKDLVETNRKKRKAFLKYLQDRDAFTKEELKKLDDILKKPIPKYAQVAEEFVVRAGLIGKIRNEVERENYSTMGVLIDRFPETIQAAKRENIVITVREQRKAEAEGRKVTIKPPSEQEMRAIQQAELHAASKVSEVNDRQMHGIREVVLQAQRERWTPQKLAQVLYDLFGDQNRDWRRVAITELAMAANDAYLSGLAEGDKVVGMGAEDACTHCRRLVIGKEFTVSHKTPKATYEYEEKYVWPGKSNYGRKVASWIPAVPLHPNCRCRWHRLSEFYRMDEGRPVMKEAWEIIQEERLKRGLGLDPNLPVPYHMRGEQGKNRGK